MTTYQGTTRLFTWKAEKRTRHYELLIGDMVVGYIVPFTHFQNTKFYAIQSLSPHTKGKLFHSIPEAAKAVATLLEG